MCFIAHNEKIRTKKECLLCHAYKNIYEKLATCFVSKEISINIKK